MGFIHGYWGLVRPYMHSIFHFALRLLPHCRQRATKVNSPLGFLAISLFCNPFTLFALLLIHCSLFFSRLMVWFFWRISTPVLTRERGAQPNNFPILSILEPILEHQKTEIINQVKQRASWFLFTDHCLLITVYWLLNVIKLGHKRSAKLALLGCCISVRG